MKNKKINMEKMISFILLLILALLFLIPIVWVFISAFKSDVELNAAGGFMVLPKTWTLENFKYILDPARNERAPVLRWMANSAFVSFIYAGLSVLIVSMSAYAYSKLKFKGRDALFIAVLFISSFPAIVNIIPLYKTMQLLKWINTPWALIFPGLANAFNIFLVKQFMIGIPDSIMESGRIDGASELRIFFRLIMPLTKPILVVVGIFSFTTVWNDFLWPSIAINDVDKLTLTAGLQLARGTFETYVSRISAISVIAILPMIILYFIAEKWLVRGVSLSAGIKG